MVVHLGRQQIVLYDPQQNQAFGFEFPKEIVSDVTVLNDIEYKKLISRALAQYKIAKQKSLIILSKDVYFVKPIDESKTEEGGVAISPADQLIEWRDAAPFANVYAKLIKQQKGSVALAASRDFFEPLIDSLNELGYSVVTLVPELVVPADLSGGLTPEMAAVISRDAKALDEFNFLESEEKPKQFAVAPTAPEDKKRTLLLAGVFLVLLLILGVVYWYVNLANAPHTEKSLPPPPPVPALPAMPPLLEDPNATSATDAASENSSQSAEPLLEFPLDNSTSSPSAQ